MTVWTSIFVTGSVSVTTSASFGFVIVRYASVEEVILMMESSKMFQNETVCDEA